MSIGRTLLKMLYPNRCFLCSIELSGEKDFCRACEGQMPYTGDTLCLRCGKRREECDCDERAGTLAGASAPIYYTGGAIKGVRRLKYNGSQQCANLLCGLMTDTVRKDFAGVAFDGLVYVPMHPVKEGVRGWSSAKMLVQRLSVSLELPVLTSGLRHTGEGGSQTEQDGREGRIANAHRNFRISRQVDHSGKTLLLVDDLLTTGATADRCAELLRYKGAREVWLVCAATTCERERVV